MDSIKAKKLDQDHVECDNYNAHIDDYAKAVMFCCSCESYLCYNCDLAKHSKSKNEDNKDEGLDMHIRVPIHKNHDDDDDNNDHDDKGKKNTSTSAADDNEKTNNKLLENAKGKEKRNSFSFKKEKKDEKDKVKDSLTSDSDPFDDDSVLVGENGTTATEQTTSTSTTSEKEQQHPNGDKGEEIDGITLNLAGIGLKKEKEVTFNNMYELHQRSNSCALEEGEEDTETDALGAPMGDTVEASNIVQGVVEGVISLGTGIADGVTGVIADPVNGARLEGVKGFFKGVGRGLSGVALKPVKGAAGMVGKVSEGVRNTPEAIFTPSHQHVDVIKEKEASHFLDGLYQGTLGLGKGIFEGVTGVVVEPIKGAQEKGGVGFIQGVGKGLLGAVCKPISGAMDFVSKPIEGLANTPQTIIDAIDERKLKKQQQQQKQDNKATNEKSNNNNNNNGKNDKNEDEDDTFNDDYEHKNDSKLLDQQQNNKDKNNSSDNNSTNNKFSPSLISPKLTSRSESQKEFNQKWLEDNKTLGKDSISSINFSASKA